MIHDILKDDLIGTCKALVICPLKALMMDQIEKLKQTGVMGAGIYEGQDEETLKQIEHGEYSIVYSSPKSILGTERWRRLFDSQYFKENCRYLVIDEAHCMVHW
eukprot:gene1244-1373_t